MFVVTLLLLQVKYLLFNIKHTNVFLFDHSELLTPTSKLLCIQHSVKIALRVVTNNGTTLKQCNQCNDDMAIRGYDKHHILTSMNCSHPKRYIGSDKLDNSGCGAFAAIGDHKMCWKRARNDVLMVMEGALR